MSVIDSQASISVSNGKAGPLDMALGQNLGRLEFPPQLEWVFKI